jgi:uncharacterized protein YegL
MERDGHLPPPLTGLLWRWGRNLTLAALALSLVLHIAGFGLARLIRLGSGGAPVAVKSLTESEPIAMAILSEGELSQLVGDNVPTPSFPEIAADSASASTMDLTPEINPAPIDAGETSISDADLGTLAGGGDITTGPGGGLSGSGGGGGGANFFGVETTGSRFIFIVDVSSSMIANGRLDRLKEELRKTLRGMNEASEFAIVLFSDYAAVLGGSTRYSQATPQTLRRLEPQIDGIMTGASTEPLPAFELSFNRSNFPRPDAIYFMTDGEFSDTVDEEIAQRLNISTPPVPIHAICFGNEDGQANMRQIAKDSGGTYTFVP